MRTLRVPDTLPAGGPLRSLAVGALVTSVGNGAWYTAWAVFLTRSVGLSPGEVGLGMTAGGVLGMLLATPVGHLADRLGPREVFLVSLVLQGLGAAAWLAVDGLGAFLVVACVTVGVAQGRGGARNALVVGLAAGEAERIRALGALRVASHLGWALGAAAVRWWSGWTRAPPTSP
jgi:predicted MFS family arabinose efflux permease